MSFTYIIIDSNVTSNTKLHHCIEGYKEFECIALTEDTIAGLNTIVNYKPSIVFINLDNDTESNFQMVSELHQYNKHLPLFIGLSKNKDLAYKAVKNIFFDYCLLPINEFEIRKSLMRIKKLKPQGKHAETICLKSNNDFKYINVNDILYLKTDGNTTDFIMKDASVNNVFKHLKTFDRLMPKNFVRIHQNYIVNSNYISGISYSRSICTLKLRRLQLPFSKPYKSNIDELNNIITKSVILSLNHCNPYESKFNTIPPLKEQL